MDTIIWRMSDDPVLRSTVTVVILLRSSPDWRRLRDTMETASAILPRLRECIVEVPFGITLPQYVQDSDFDIDNHLHRTSVGANADLRTVLDLAQDTAMVPFDPKRPLWEMTLIEGLALDEAGAAVVLKIHHALADGVGGLAMAVAAIFDAEADPTPASVPDAAPPEQSNVLRLVADRIGDIAGSARTTAVSFGRGTLQATSNVLTAPVDTIDRTVENSRSLGRLLKPATAPKSEAMVGRSTGRHFEVLDVELAELKAAASAVGASVNDVFLTAVCTGLAGYHEKVNAPTDTLNMTMAVNLRSDGHSDAGNQMAPLRFEVPVGNFASADRARELGDISRKWRDEPAIDGHFGTVTAVLSRLPRFVLHGVLGGLYKNVDFATSNLIGVPATLWLAGVETTRWYPFGPTTGAAVNITLLTMASTCHVGINSDTKAVVDPALLRTCIDDAFAQTLLLAQRS